LLRAITFDFWNTLYKAPAGQEMSNWRISAFQKILLQLGRPADPVLVRIAIEDCWRYAHKYQREYGMDITPRGHLDYILQQLRLDLKREEWQQVYQVFTSILLAHPPQLNEGVAETLPQLAEKYKLAVICNTGITPGLLLREIMKADDIFRFFDFLTFSDEVKWAKPNVKIFNYTLENLQVQNGEAAHIGDDSSSDVTGAKMAGMTAVWLAPLPMERCTDCDYQVSSVSELVKIFETAGCEDVR
jgi:HAD superfamily hydrolase (TIGR01549 family)